MDFEQGNHNFIATVNVVICDAPARQFSKSTRSHNLRYACQSYAVEDEYFGNCMAFLSTTPALRSYGYFDNLVYTNHHLVILTLLM